MKAEQKPTPNWPISCASLAESPLKVSRNFLVPDRAMVPRLSMISASLMPMPLSLMLKVPASVSGVSVIDSASLPKSSGLAIASKRNFSQASEAFEISSRRKISLCEYSEWITKRSTCLVSAWNSLICGFCAAAGSVSVVMAFRSLGLVWVSWGRGTILQARIRHGDERHPQGGMGSTGRQCAGGGGEIRCRRDDRLGGHAERGGAFAGRHDQ